MTEDKDQKLEIDWLRTVAGALAAVSSAVALSTLGAAGTIIGAALGSVIITFGGALYGHGLNQSRRRLAEAQTLTLRKVGIAQAEVRRANRTQGDETAVDAHLTHADERLDEAKEDLDALADEPAEPGWRERLAVLPWKRIALIAAGLFAATVLAITAFEILAGRSVSSITGGTDGDDGTTISRIGGGSGDDSREDDEGPAEEEAPQDEPTDEAPADEPSEAPSESPSDDDTPTPTPTPSADTPLPTEPTAEPPSE
jgi:hypothetical protein